MIETENVEREGLAAVVQVDEEFRDIIFPEAQGGVL